MMATLTATTASHQHQQLLRPRYRPRHGGSAADDDRLHTRDPDDDDVARDEDDEDDADFSDNGVGEDDDHAFDNDDDNAGERRHRHPRSHHREQRQQPEAEVDEDVEEDEDNEERPQRRGRGAAGGGGGAGRGGAGVGPGELVPAELKLVQLRSELKKLGLSPSGLKHVLVKRLEDALAQLGRAGPSPAPGSSTATALPPPSSTGMSQHQRNSHAQHTSDDDAEDLPQEAEAQDTKHTVANAKGNEEDDDVSTYAATSNSSTSNSGRALTHKRKKNLVAASPDGGGQLNGKKRSKRHRSSRKKLNSSRSSHDEGHRQRHPHDHDPDQGGFMVTSPEQAEYIRLLSGRTFVKEARYTGNHNIPEGMTIKSIEQFRFDSSTFHFGYQFWRGDTLLHAFEVEAGSFMIVDETDPTQENTDNTAGDDGRRCKIVLHWPSPVYYPLLQTWRFHHSYTHFLLYLQEPPNVKGYRSDSSPMAMAASSSSSLFLVSRLGSVFVERSS